MRTATEELEHDDQVVASNAGSCISLANEYLERAAQILGGGELLSDDVRDVMLVAGYRVATEDRTLEHFTLGEARAAIRAVYGESPPRIGE